MSQPLSPSIKYSDDVKEVAYLVDYIAKKRIKSTLSKSPEEPIEAKSIDVLQALCNVSRRFSYPDALLREIGTTPKAIENTLKTVLKQAKALHSLTPSETLFHQAEEGAGESSESKTVNAGHLLWALTQIKDTDPTLRQILDQHHITPENLQKAIKTLEEPQLLGLAKRTINTLLFIVRETFEMIFVVIICLIIIKQGIGELRLIPSESMVPTLKVGDRVVVEKISRWYRQPQRNDVMVFYPPPPDSVIKKDPFSLFMRATGFSSLFHNTVDDPLDKAYIKRLIALPGDEVVVVNHLGVYVNGILQQEPFINEVAIDCGAFCYPKTIPEGYYFMLGDNRNHSKDSRYFGLQPANRMVGRAIYRVFPFNRFAPL